MDRGEAILIARPHVLRGTIAPLHLSPTTRLRLTDIGEGQRTAITGTVIMMEMADGSLFT